MFKICQIHDGNRQIELANTNYQPVAEAILALFKTKPGEYRIVSEVPVLVVRRSRTIADMADNIIRRLTK